MLKSWPVAVWTLALGLTGVAGMLVRQTGAREAHEPELITLRSLSQRWLKPMRQEQGRENRHISELAHLWRNEELIAQKALSCAFIHLQAQDFYAQLQAWSFFRQAVAQRQVCINILQLLDQEGDLPSVVNVQGDVESGWEANTYQILAKTTLLDHSLNVAAQVVALLSGLQAWHVIPDTMVAALGHDLGKLNHAHSTLYSLGEHPLASCATISGIPGFKELARKDEILRAIKLHHKMPDGLLGKTLKKADQQARQQELERWTDREQVEKDSRVDAVAQRQRRSVQNTSLGSVVPLHLSSAEPGTASDQPEAQPPNQMDISAWFDAAAFLALLKPLINRLEGRRYFAFSMASGLVYFQVKALEEAARKQAGQAGCMQIATMAQDDLSMRAVLLSIVQRLRQEEGIIAQDLIKPGYFGGYFQVIRRHGKELKGYYTPFHSEAFGSIAGMEAAKPALLKDILKVSPFTGCTQEE